MVLLKQEQDKNDTRPAQHTPLIYRRGLLVYISMHGLHRPRGPSPPRPSIACPPASNVNNHHKQQKNTRSRARSLPRRSPRRACAGPSGAAHPSRRFWPCETVPGHAGRAGPSERRVRRGRPAACRPEHCALSPTLPGVSKERPVHTLVHAFSGAVRACPSLIAALQVRVFVGEQGGNCASAGWCRVSLPQ